MTEHLSLYTLVNAQGLGKELSYLDQSYLALKQLGVILGGIHSSVLDRISYLNCPWEYHDGTQPIVEIHP